MMRTETSTIEVPLGDIVTIDGEEVFVPNGETVTVTSVDIFADEGKKFRRISDGVMLSGHITLGTNDSAENYEEVTP